MEDMSKERKLIKQLSDTVDGYEPFPTIPDVLGYEEKCNQPECCKCCPNNKNDYCFCTLPYQSK